MKTQHTPGPWAVSKIGNPYEQYIIHAEEDSTGRNIAGSVEGRANAHLIAAAPELLEALKLCLETARFDSKRSFRAVIAARNAIEKAEGSK